MGSDPGSLFKKAALLLLAVFAPASAWDSAAWGNPAWETIGMVDCSGGLHFMPSAPVGICSLQIP